MVWLRSCCDSTLKDVFDSRALCVEREIEDEAHDSGHMNANERMWIFPVKSVFLLLLYGEQMTNLDLTAMQCEWPWL